jgi:hypothetical protein
MAGYRTPALHHRRHSRTSVPCARRAGQAGRCRTRSTGTRWPTARSTAAQHATHGCARAAATGPWQPQVSAAACAPPRRGRRGRRYSLPAPCSPGRARGDVHPDGEDQGAPLFEHADGVAHDPGRAGACSCLLDPPQRRRARELHPGPEPQERGTGEDLGRGRAGTATPRCRSRGRMARAAESVPVRRAVARKGRNALCGLPRPEPFARGVAPGCVRRATGYVCRLRALSAKPAAHKSPNPRATAITQRRTAPATGSQ